MHPPASFRKQLIVHIICCILIVLLWIGVVALFFFTPPWVAGFCLFAAVISTIIEAWLLRNFFILREIWNEMEAQVEARRQQLELELQP